MHLSGPAIFKTFSVLLLLTGRLYKIFNPDWNFNSLNRVEISSRLNSKHLFKMTLQLHVKISTLYAELKFQLGLAKSRWKFQIFRIIDIFSNQNSLFIFKKMKIATSQARFKWTNKMFTRIQKFHGIQILRLRHWQSQIIWKCEKMCSRNIWRWTRGVWSCFSEWKSI